MSKPLTIASWVLRVLIAAMFLMAGINKLIMNADAQAMFDELGVGTPGMLFTGVLEVVAAVVVVVPKTVIYGAALAAALMLGAIVSHVAVLSDDSMLPMAFVLLLASAGVGVLHRRELPMFKASEDAKLAS